MPIPHPVTGEPCLTVKEAADYLTAHGLPTSPASLNSDRTKGHGPQFFKLGKMVYYKEVTLEAYVLSKLTEEVQSTSQLKAAKQLLIEARPNGGDVQ